MADGWLPGAAKVTPNIISFTKVVSLQGKKQQISEKVLMIAGYETIESNKNIMHAHSFQNALLLKAGRY